LAGKWFRYPYRVRLELEFPKTHQILVRLHSRIDIVSS
jgi:hypothetical protein